METPWAPPDAGGLASIRFGGIKIVVSLAGV